MLDTSDVIAFAATTELARARTFYEFVLGLRMVEENPFVCVFDANGRMLRLTAVAEVAHPAYTVLGWRVEGIKETLARLESYSSATTACSRAETGSGRPLAVTRLQVYRPRWQRSVSDPFRVRTSRS